MVSGPVLSNIKGKSWIFMKKFDFGGSKNKTKTKKWNEIGQMLVSGALDDIKTIGKVGADIFVISGPEKKTQNRKLSKFSRGFSPFFPWT